MYQSKIRIYVYQDLCFGHPHDFTAPYKKKLSKPFRLYQVSAMLPISIY